MARGALTAAPELRAVVLVEGVSDEVALETLARRRDRDLAAEGARIVRIGGAHSIGRFLGRFGPGVALAGFCDAGEEAVFRKALERAGRGRARTREQLARLGFYVCDADLEDELIRSLGIAGVESVFAAQGELDGFRMFQQQPAQRGRPVTAQLRRFLGTRSGRKQLYARLLVDALDLRQVPAPLDGVLAHLDRI